METLKKILKENKINSRVFFNEKASKHTTFKTGGLCDVLIIPETTDELQFLLSNINTSITVIGGGANLLVSDNGVRGTVIKTVMLRDISHTDRTLVVSAGADVSDVCRYALKHSLSGFEFINGMPGTIGGAVWMNARCNGKSISDLLTWVDYINTKNIIKRYHFSENDFSYKDSPFQHNSNLIISACFKVSKGHRKEIKQQMRDNYKDRKSKGHFTYPCAGSVFKNNREFGKPSGMIIESCGLKGTRKGGAQIAPFHGNIIINRGKALSKDVLYLIELIEDTVYKKFGFKLEREIQLIGKW